MTALFSSYSVKITGLLLILSLFPIVGIGYFFYSEEIKNLQYYQTISLTSQSENTSDIVSKWLTEREKDVMDIASNKVLISKTNIIANSDVLNEVYHANFNLQTQSAILLKNHPWLFEYVISDQNGKILFSTGDRIPKENLIDQIHFKNALGGKLGISDIYKSQDVIKNENGFYEQGVPTMWISYPIKGEIGINGILSARVDIFQIPHTTNKQKEYNSLDVYIVNSNGYFISKPKFSDLNDEIKRRRVLEIPIREHDSQDFTQIFQLANQKETKLNLSGYNNYVGEMVIGSITHVENTNWYVIAEISKDESDSRIIPTQIILFDFISLLILIIIGTSIYISSKIMEPIKNLKKVMEFVSNGNFDVKLKPKGNDEITFLFKSFNSMTASLKNAINQISFTELKYKQLYDGSPDLYRTINPSGIILDCNIAYAKSLGYTKEEVIGKSIFDHVDKNSLDRLQNTFKNWKKVGNVRNIEIRMRRKDGSSFPTIFSVSSIYDEKGQLIGSNTAIRDITELDNAKKEIEESQKKIQKQIEDLKKVDKAKDEFLTMITHELKTPLVPIQGYADILLGEHLGKLTDKQKERISIIKSSSETLLSLISDLLDAQKLELGRLRLEKNVYNISEIIKEVVVKLKPGADIYGVSITQELQENVLCLCDKFRIEQILMNLISNSLDFSPKQTGKITIKLSREGDQIKITVKDNGIGIIKESIDKIFVKFYQVDTSNIREHRGTGLGLSVCKGIVENHGGKIWAESEGRDKGTKIHILLPISTYN